MLFLPSLNYFGPAQVSIYLSDLANTGTGGVFVSAILAIDIDVVSVNDAPVVTINPPSFSTPEDTPLALGSVVAITDPDFLDGAIPPEAKVRSLEGAITDTSIRNVAVVNSAAVSDMINIHFFATRFARLS